ncbi:predicted protein [Lichtheimia corymbifera JMRC:FSU:9682]|uniref:Uncharacterized protein n=1 Tax=Lichtheimia corymbifera JMRC:FSU:9682 TaxID=1263082 RepID=A0A068SG51_9FUNG|nr:predicted protein [Lichtheimia corymbifera JMRC:FSU:9682]
MRFSSSFVLLAAMFMLGVTATGETTSTAVATGPVLSPELQKKVDDYVKEQGDRAREAESLVDQSKATCRISEADQKPEAFDRCFINLFGASVFMYNLPSFQS